MSFFTNTLSALAFLAAALLVYAYFSREPSILMLCAALP